MANIIFPKRWTIKPPVGIQLNWGHPMTQGAQMVLPLNEGQGAIAGSSSPIRDLVRNRTLQPEAGTVTAVHTQGGIGLNFNSVGGVQLTLGSDTNIPCPTTECTILCIRRKTDATARVCSLFGTNGASGSEILNCHCPYSDGTCYWDFGGNTGSNRISVASIPVTGVQKWAFVAGPHGSAIYLNGILQASQSTAITRTNGGTNVYLNAGQAGLVSADLQDIYFFAILNAEWNAGMVMWWNQEPFGMFAPAPALRRIYVPPAAAAPVMTAFGDDSWGIAAISGWDQKATVF